MPQDRAQIGPKKLMAENINLQAGLKKPLGGGEKLQGRKRQTPKEK